MLLGNLTIGSSILVDLNKNGQRNCVCIIASKVSDYAISVEIKPQIPIDEQTVIVEITDDSTGHVYRYTKCKVYKQDDLLVIESSEDVDYHKVRQEKRFDYKMPCSLKCDNQYIRGASLNDVSMSGLSVIIPNRIDVRVGDIINIITYYTDGVRYKLTVSIMRIDNNAKGEILIGCKIIDGKNFTKAVIEKLQHV